MREDVLILCERELLRLNRSPRTIREVVACARRFLGERAPAQIGREDVRRFLAATQKRGLTRSTHASYLGSLRTFFQALVRRGLLDADPTQGLRAPAPKARPVLASPEHGGYLLLRNDGKPHGASDVNKMVDRVARRAGLARAHPHALRRAIATHLVEAGASISVVQWLLGHEEIRTTARYISVDRKALRLAVARLTEARKPLATYDLPAQAG